MKVYHSSSVIVEHPDTKHSRKYLDFGQGFYLTTLYEQAKKYGERFLRRNKEAWLNVYELNFDAPEWNVKQFEAYNREWLDFVAKCRAGEPTEKYDMVIGGIANDKVILTLDLYFAGEISQDEALKKLKYERPNIQYCILSQRLLDTCLTYIESEQL